jgi:hypothetical protein
MEILDLLPAGLNPLRGSGQIWEFISPGLSPGVIHIEPLAWLTGLNNY